MITIKEIIHLTKNGLLKDCRFIPGDAANCCIEVRNGIAMFIQRDIPLTDLSQDEIDKIDNENNYYIESLYKELPTE